MLCVSVLLGPLICRCIVACVACWNRMLYCMCDWLGVACLLWSLYYQCLSFECPLLLLLLTCMTRLKVICGWSAAVSVPCCAVP